MAEYYVDHGLYGAPVAGGTTPTAAEEGNGKATGPATMATLVITFNGQPTAGQTITIAGVVFTAVASGATANQFNIGANASTTAGNLRTAINASTANATQPANVIRSTAPLRNVVNAAGTGAVITIYTRSSGSEWNTVTENSTLSNVVLTQWSGGADGAWGYLINTAAVWPTSQAIGAYGLWAAQMPYLCNVQGGDVVHVRAGNKLLNFTATATVTMSAMGSETDPVRFLIDDSTVWNDGHHPTLTVQISAASNTTFTLTGVQTTFAAIHGKTYNRETDTRNMLFTCNSAASSVVFQLALAPAAIEFSDVNLMTVGTSASARVALHLPGAPSIRNRSYFKNGLVAQLRQSTAALVSNSGNMPCNASIVSSNIKLLDATDIATSIISYPNVAYSLEFLGCKFEGFVPGSRLLAPTTNSPDAGQVRLYDCEMGGVTDLGPSFFQSTTPAHDGSLGRQGVIGSTKHGKRDFFYNTASGFYDWNSLLGFPTLNARLLDNTPWSLRVIPPSLNNNVNASNPLRLPVISKINSLPTAIRSVQVEFGLEKSLSWNAGDIFFVVEYIDNNNIIRVESTQDYSRSALTQSDAPWSTNTDDNGVTRFTWASPALIYFNRYKLATTTQHPIKTDTEVSVTVCVARTVNDTTKILFIDPEVLLT